jgi:hypothetical protein
MAALVREGEELVVYLRDLERVGAMSGDVRVPIRCVREVRVTEAPFGEVRGIRAPGTGVPRVVALGTWRGKHGKDFVAVYRGEPGVVVELEGAPFARLIVSGHDAQRVAKDLKAAKKPPL